MRYLFLIFALLGTISAVSVPAAYAGPSTSNNGEHNGENQNDLNCGHVGDEC